MKKKLPLFLSIISLSTLGGFLTSCGGGDEPFKSKVKLDYGDYRNSEMATVNDLHYILYGRLKIYRH